MESEIKRLKDNLNQEEKSRQLLEDELKDSRDEVHGLKIILSEKEDFHNQIINDLNLKNEINSQNARQKFQEELQSLNHLHSAVSLEKNQALENFQMKEIENQNLKAEIEILSKCNLSSYF